MILQWHLAFCIKLELFGNVIKLDCGLRIVNRDSKHNFSFKLMRKVYDSRASQDLAVKRVTNLSYFFIHIFQLYRTPEFATNCWIVDCKICEKRTFSIVFLVGDLRIIFKNKNQSLGFELGLRQLQLRCSYNNHFPKRCWHLLYCSNRWTKSFVITLWWVGSSLKDKNTVT